MTVPPAPALPPPVPVPPAAPAPVPAPPAPPLLPPLPPLLPPPLPPAPSWPGHGMPVNGSPPGAGSGFSLPMLLTSSILCVGQISPSKPEGFSPAFSRAAQVKSIQLLPRPL
ncbi:hypothetical protein C9I28_26790 [Pseudoduganella armeniaca]|uniref:Uncharacterized protein n=1 Tax=Pseudoduganella armeniaca TaxID=2072590 RepID=A0A2R4CGN1_9BURK|nr:hypothetical protein C9I28_26790 [Pseudoduganella armeniaca]